MVTVHAKFNVYDHVFCLINNKPEECIVRGIEFPTVFFKAGNLDARVKYTLVTKKEWDYKTKENGLAQSTVQHFTKTANEVSDTIQNLFEQLKNQYNY